MTLPITTLSLCICGDPACEIPHGLCHCECGKETGFYKNTLTRLGHRKGARMLYLSGHTSRVWATLEERFWEKVNKNGPVVKPHLGACWIWIASKDGCGYGTLGAPPGNSKGLVTLKAHRVSYEINVGALIDGLQVLHHCDNPPCVNPDHLFQGSVEDNMRDASRKRRLRFGAAHPRTTLTEDVVLRMRVEYAGGNTTYRKIADKYGVPHGSISAIIDGRSWKYAGSSR